MFRQVILIPLHVVFVGKMAGRTLRSLLWPGESCCSEARRAFNGGGGGGNFGATSHSFIMDTRDTRAAMDNRGTELDEF